MVPFDLTPVNGASVYERIQTGRSPERIFQMPKKRYDVDQIIPMLRRADVELGKGRKVPEVCKMLGIVQQTYYRWRQKYGSMAPEMARELKALQKENSQLKKLVADQALDNAILKEAAKGNFQAPSDVAAPWMRYVVNWGPITFHSGVRVECLANQGRRSATSRVVRLMNAG